MESDREEAVTYKEDAYGTEENEEIWEQEKTDEIEEPEESEDSGQEEPQDVENPESILSSDAGYAEKTSDSIGQAQKRMEELLRTLDNL